MSDGPGFISLGDAQERLNVSSRSQMQNLFPHLPHVYVKSRKTRLFPTGYIHGLAKHLDGNGATIQLVREYNLTDTARELYGGAVEGLARAINSRTEHTPTQVAKMLGVGRTTVSGWMGDGALPFEARAQKEGRPVSPYPKGQLRVIKTLALHRFLEWRAPH